MNIKNAKPIKVGCSYYFTIPKQFIDNGIIELDKKYNLKVSGTKEVDLSHETIKKKTREAIIKQTKKTNLLSK